ncbi:MAG: cyclic GMP-AMP synthase DncV-like nucleotidyltransferase [Micropepsaceae bacterium]
MYDCADDVLAHHDEDVTLPQSERTTMRERRDANRTRLKKGLKEKGKPAPLEFKSQGSYAMKTMVQHPEKDYDIDDGVYFAKEDLVGERGAEMSALQTRQMVRDALDDGSFKTPPEVRTNCVRVHYEAGYHVDVPVYRRVAIKEAFGNDTYHHELASSDWKRSDASEVTDWFEKENNTQSPDAENGRQLRRVTRQIKKFARSRESWTAQILSGFGITKLVTERFRANKDREDTALYETMKAIRDRLNYDLVVKHPVTPNETITKGNDDACARFLREKLTEAIDALAPLFDSNCTREKALKCWDKVFATKFFSARLEKTEEANKAARIAAPAILTSGLLSAGAAAAQPAVRKEGGGRYA